MPTSRKPGQRYPREKETTTLALHRDIMAVIRAEAVEKDQTLEAVVAERFGVEITPGRPKHKNAASRPATLRALNS